MNEAKRPERVTVPGMREEVLPGPGRSRRTGLGLLGHTMYSATVPFPGCRHHVTRGKCSYRSRYCSRVKREAMRRTMKSDT